jgi:multidrug efflux pump subunit AcrA (membrane-fusion protein)
VRILKIMLITFILGGLLAIPGLSCTSESESAVSESQIVTVQRGDLTIDITAAGNLALSLMEDLAFEMSGTVEEVLVEEGDSVEEGQVLAKLDTSEWDKELTKLEIDLLQAEINLRNAELALEQAEEPYSRDDIKSAEAAVDSAEASLEYAEWQLDEAEDLGDEELIRRYQSEVIRAEANFVSTEANLEAMEDAPDPDEVAIKELQLELAEARFEDAEEALEEALENGPEIIAPFDGFITRVNVEGGDEVLKGTVAVQLADPDSFEADILVSEMDILQVKLGGEAWVQVDAMQGLSLPAEVTHVSPTATIQSGVVNYEVKVEVQPREAVMQQRQQAMQNITPGEIPERLKQAIEAGQITQEQAEEMMKQMQESQRGQQGQIPAMGTKDFQLREGLTITVSIIVDERSDVLLVPNGAIATQGKQTYVQVVLPDGTTEERAITTGISDWQYTEVTSGLSEGEEVVVTQGTSTTSTTSQPRPRGPMPFLGGPPH